VELVPYRVRCSNPVTGPRAIRVADQGVVKGVEYFMEVGKDESVVGAEVFFGNSIKSDIICRGGRDNQRSVLGWRGLDIRI